MSVLIQGKDSDKTRLCRECAFCTVVTRFHTLSVDGNPTMGECPNWTKSRCVLLSQRACKMFEEKSQSKP